MNRLGKVCRLYASLGPSYERVYRRSATAAEYVPTVPNLKRINEEDKHLAPGQPTSDNIADPEEG
jgi:hypothetical protein